MGPMVALALVFPLLLLVVLTMMERVERPLRDESLGERLAEMLDNARPDEVETLVRQGSARALERYWRRQRGLARRVGQT